MPKRENISMSVIRRLPRYYRFLKLLGEKGVTRISSTELSAKLGLPPPKSARISIVLVGLGSRDTATWWISSVQKSETFWVYPMPTKRY